MLKKIIFIINVFLLNKLFAFENKTIGEFCEKRIEKKVFIKIAQLEKDLNEKLSNESSTLNDEFEKFPSGQLFISDVGQLSENKMKNRDETVLAYDHSRVIIKKTDSDGDDEKNEGYINANFIDGVLNKNRYIITQSPTEESVNDFWSMVWQQNVHIIVMLGNFLEKGKENSIVYWSYEGKRYGNLTVSHVKTDIFIGDIFVRTLHISNNRHHRQIKMYQLVNMNENEQLPEYASHLLLLINRVQSSKDYKASKPILVHDRLGVGRSGIYVLADSLIEAAKRMKKIDVAAQLCSMLAKRMNLIENLDQYKFVHKVVAEAVPQLNQYHNEFI